MVKRSVMTLLAASMLGLCAQDIKVDNTAKYVGNGRYDWTVFIVAEKAVLSGIKAVEYTLHPTFPNPVRQSRGPDFAITANGCG
jgi:transcription initiation factor IIF auxiliary subunit